MKTLVVPTDFSPASVNSMNYAADMALQIGGQLILMNVYQIPVAITETPLALISVDELREGVERQLNEAKRGLDHITSGKVQTSIHAVMGDTTEEIQNLCEHVQPFAVVMGTMGHSAIERTLFGSTTLKVIRHLTWPIISIPAGKEYGKGIQKVGLACDFKELAEAMPIPAIRTFVKQFNAELHVLNVNHNGGDNQSSTNPVQLLYTALEELGPRYHNINNKDIEEGINEFAELNNLDIIITIPRKQKLLDNLFRRNSTRELLYHTHVPVMCVH